MKITGKIESIVTKEVTTKATGEVNKVASVKVKETFGEYPNSIILDIFGTERVENFIKYNPIGQVREVTFNSRTQEYNGREFNKLNLFRADKVDEAVSQGEEVAFDD